MTRLLRTLHHGLLCEVKRLVTRVRRGQDGSLPPEGVYAPAFDPTMPTRAASYGPGNGRTYRTRGR